MAGEPDFDLVSASLRADAADLGTFLEVLAGKMEAALPGAVEVRRSGGLFRKEHPVREILLSLGEWQFRLAARPGGELRAERAHTVRGIALSSEQMEVDAWLEALLQALAAHAKSSATAAESLHRLLS
jgi:hypothetical protein